MATVTSSITARRTKPPCLSRRKRCWLARPLIWAQVIAEAGARVRQQGGMCRVEFASQGEAFAPRHFEATLAAISTGGMLLVLREITARKLAEEALRESEARWQFALEGAGDGVWDWNPITGEAFFSPGWKQMFGYREDEISQSVQESISRVHPEDWPVLRAATADYLTGRCAEYVCEFRMRCKDGGYKWVLARGKVVARDEEGRVLRLIGTHADIYRQKAVELALKESQQLLRTVIDEIPSVILMKDWDGRFLLANQALAQLYGTTTDALVGRTDGDFNRNAEQVAGYLASVREVMRRGITQTVFEDSTDRITGEIRHFQSVKKPVRDVDGKPCILVIATDITELRRSQARIVASEQTLRYVLDATQEAVWDWQVESGALSVNGRWLESLACAAGEMTGGLDDFLRHLVDEDKPGVMAAVQASLSGKGLYRSEHRMRRSDGSQIWVLDRGNVVERDAQGKPLRMVGSWSDITERKQVEEELRQHRDNLADLVELQTADVVRAKQAAELDNQAKTEILTNMSHALRTPMHAILGFATLGEKKAHSGDGVRLGDYFARIRSSGERLMNLLNQLLDLSKLEAGRMVLDLKAQPLAPLIQEVMGELGPLAEARPVALDLVLADDVPPVRVDGMRFSQIVRNLVANAIKFSPPGHPVRVGLEKRSGAVVLMVSDHGPGIPEDELETVFDKFVQSSKTRTGAGGTGLGLAICRELVEAHGGHIRARNKEAGGAEFEVLLPLPEEEGDVEMNAKAPGRAQT